MATATADSSARIDIPLKVTLTSEATEYFMRIGRPLKRLHLSNSGEAYGFTTESIETGMLHRLIATNYLRGMEYVSATPVRKRSEIRRICELVTRGLLFTKFTSEVHDEVLATPEVQAWNRSHPHAIIDTATRFKPDVVQQELLRQAKRITELKRRILKPVIGRISNDEMVEERDKRDRRGLSLDYLNNISNETWYLILFAESKLEADITTTVPRILDGYVRKSTVGDYLALLVVELVVFALNTNLVHCAERTLRSGIHIEQILADEQLHKRLMDDVQKRGEEIAVSWTVSNRGQAGRRRLAISIGNKGAYSGDLRTEVNEKKNAKTRSLGEFFEEGGVNRDMTMGLMYLGYVREACEALDVHFESSVDAFSNRENTILNIFLDF
ncbi:MAG: hypothetical protein ACLFM0_04270 [Spirochaetales bacterium]